MRAFLCRLFFELKTWSFDFIFRPHCIRISISPPRLPLSLCAFSSGSIIPITNTPSESSNCALYPSNFSFQFFLTRFANDSTLEFVAIELKIPVRVCAVSAHCIWSVSIVRQAGKSGTSSSSNKVTNIIIKCDYPIPFLSLRPTQFRYDIQDVVQSNTRALLGYRLGYPELCRCFNNAKKSDVRCVRHSIYRFCFRYFSFYRTS